MGVYAVWDNENKRFYEDKSGNISTFTDKGEADSYRDTLYVHNERDTSFTEPETAKEVETPLYNIGDRLEYNGKPHEIDQIGEFIRLHNFGTPSPYPIFDYISIPKQNFDRMLSDGEIVIAANQEIADKPVELDFDTAAQIIYERVMQNKVYADYLENALNRSSFHNLVNLAFELIFTEEMEKGDPQNLRSYFADYDFNDKLFGFVYQKAWESRRQREAEAVTQTEQTAKPTSEKLLSQDGTDFY